MRLSTPSCIQMWTPDKKNYKMQEYYLYPQYELSQQLHVACSDGPPPTMHTVVQRFATYKGVCVLTNNTDGFRAMLFSDKQTTDPLFKSKDE